MPRKKTVPANRPPPQPQDRNRATAAAKADLRERQDAQTRVPQENHDKEKGQAGVPAAELQQRHQAKIQGQQKQHSVEQHELDTREQRATPRR